MTVDQLLQLKDLNDNFLINFQQIKEGTDLILLGKPVRFADDMQAPATDSLSLAYGDFRVGYTIVDRLGMRVLRDPFTDKPFIKFYATKRVGGDVTNYESIKLLKLAT